MKANLFLTVIAVLLGALLGYFAYSVACGAEGDLLCGIGSSLCFIATLVPIMGLQYDDERLGVNIRLMSLLFFIVFVISHFMFASHGVKMPLYIIVNGIILLVELAVVYKMTGIKQV